MARSFNIEGGAEVVYDGKFYTVLYIIHSTAGLEAADGSFHHAPKDALRPIEEKVKAGANRNTIDIPNPDTKRFRDAERKYEMIKAYLAGRISASECAELASISESSVYRYARSFRSTGTVSGLERKVHRNKGDHLHPAYPHAREKLASRRRFRRGYAKALHAQLKQIAKTKKFGFPSIDSVRRWIRERKEELASIELSEHFGEPTSSLDYYPDKPFFLLQIDHTLLRFGAVNDDGEEIGQLWLTVAIDMATRLVVGWYLTLDPPSSMSIAMTLDMVVLPDSYLRVKFGLTDLPCGKFTILHADNAGEMRSEGLTIGINSHGMNVIWRPVGKPRYGAYVERWMGTFKQLMIEAEIPGTYRYDDTEKERRKALKQASMTLEEAEKAVTELITAYNNRTHSSLGVSPVQRYKDLLKGSLTKPGTGGIERVQDEAHFRVSVLPKLERDRVLHDRGIVVDHFWYYSHALKSYIRKYKGTGKTFEIRVNQHKLDRIYVRIEDDKYLTVPTANRRLPFSSSERKAAYKTLNLRGIPTNKRGEELVYQEILKNRRKLPKGKTTQTERRQQVSEVQKSARGAAYTVDRSPARTERKPKAKNKPAVEVIAGDES